MKTSQLPENEKYYVLVLSSRKEFVIRGDAKVKILESSGQFFVLPTGETINKNFIEHIRLDHGLTKSKWEGEKMPEKGSLVLGVKRPRKQKGGWELARNSK